MLVIYNNIKLRWVQNNYSVSWVLNSVSILSCLYIAVQLYLRSQDIFYSLVLLEASCYFYAPAVPIICGFRALGMDGIGNWDASLSVKCGLYGLEEGELPQI
jgi:hypothetical protein